MSVTRLAALRRALDGAKPDEVVALVLDAALDLLAAERSEIWLVPPSGESLELADRRVRAASYPRAVDVTVPLSAGGERLGALVIARDAARPFSEADTDVAELLAAQAVAPIAQARLHAAAERSHARLLAALRASRGLVPEAGIDRALGHVLAEAAAIASVGQAAIWLVNDEREELRLEAATGGPVPVGFAIPLGATAPFDSHALAVAVTGAAVVLDDVPALDTGSLVDLYRQADVRAYLGLPLRLRDRVLGVLTLADSAPRRWSAADVSYFQVFADHAALAVERARLYKRLADGLARRRTLTRLTRLISSSLDTANVLREITRAAAELLDAPIAALWLPDEATRTLTLACASDERAIRDVPVRRVAYGETSVGWAAVHREIVAIPDVRADVRYPDVPRVRARGLRAFAAVPIVFRGELLAVLALHGAEPFRFDEDHRDVVETFVAQTAVTFRNARLFAATEIRRREAETLAEVGHALARTRDPDEVARHVVAAVGALFAADSVALYRLDEATGGAVPLAAVGPIADVLARTGPIPRGECVVGRAIAERRPVTTGDLLHDPCVPLSPPLRAAFGGIGLRSVVSVPLEIEHGIVGAMSIGRATGAPFGEQEVRVAQAFADQAAVALESARLYRATQLTVSQLSARNADLDAFVYSVSHDLKAPLIALQGMAGALREDCGAQLDARGRHYLERLEANVRQMERLVTDLLALSRVGREGRPPEMLNLDELVADVLVEFNAPIRTRGIAVDVEPLGTIAGVRIQVEQLMRNLMSNAVKYLGETDAPRIEIGRRDGPDGPELRVADNGAGIDPEHHARVFEVFQRLKDVDVEGSGVGLAIVKKIVETNGGRVWVESSRGAGATFRFTWPAPEVRP